MSIEVSEVSNLRDFFRFEVSEVSEVSTKCPPYKRMHNKGFLSKVDTLDTFLEG